MTYQDIKYEIDGRIAYVTLNRPEKLNALSNNLRGEMIHAMKEAEAATEVAVVILRAEGRAFSAGYDLTPSRAANEGQQNHRNVGADPVVEPEPRQPGANSSEDAGTQREHDHRFRQIGAGPQE